MKKQTFNLSLHNQLPAQTLESKQLLAVNIGSVSPYIIYEADGSLTGAAIELFQAIGEILGVSIKYEITSSGVSGILMGTQSARYDFGIGPLGDTPERRKNHDIIAYTISYGAAAVLKGNPKNIHSQGNFCGNRTGVSSGSLGEKILTAQSEQCVKQGKSPIDILIFKDVPSMILALKSGRIDVYSTMVSMISYYVSNSNGELEMVTLDKDYRYYGAVVNKDSPLGPVILAALQELYANGTYAEIMKKWHMEAAILPKPGINLAK